MIGGEQAGQRPVGGPSLGVDVLDVMSGRLAGDDEMLADLLVRQAPGQQPENFDLTAGQASRPSLPAGRTVPGGGQHGGHRLAIHPACPDLGAQLGCCLVGRACETVGPRLGP